MYRMDSAPGLSGPAHGGGTVCGGAFDRHDVVAAISHEFRTPLAIIEGYLEILFDEPGAADAEDQRRVVAIHRNAERLCRTVDHLLWALSGRLTRDRPALRDTDVTDVVRSGSARPRPDGRVRIHAPAAPVLVPADPLLLRQAIDNLVDNALLYSGSGTTVDVTVVDGPNPAVEIVDRGVGMGADELAHLGEPFFRGRYARDGALPGLGLGLYVTRQIVAAHHGALGVRSTPGLGTVARISFPS